MFRRNKYTEDEILKQYISLAAADKSCSVLDVGCGYGRHLRLVEQMGLTGLGVDINPSVVELNNASGLKCVTADQFKSSDEMFNVILMSHLIEHFRPEELLPFMDGYLKRLKTGGHLIIATPLMWGHFYDDFDHVRPYPPCAIDWMYCVDKPRTQYCSEFVLETAAIQVRKVPYTLPLGYDIYLGQNYPSIQQFFVAAMEFIFKISFGVLGQANGWVGLYRMKGLRNKL